MTHSLHQDETNIVLCGGPINFSTLPLGTNRSNAMIPVNGKPVVGWILDDLLEKGIRQAAVVLRSQDEHLRNFLRWAYAGRMALQTVPLHTEGTIVQALQAGLRGSPAQGLVRIILGDTLIRDTFHASGDLAYVGDVEDSRRWCLVRTSEDGVMVEYFDKQSIPSPNKRALAGYYQLRDGAYLQQCVSESIAHGERELSDVLRRYGRRFPVSAKPVRDWMDFGNIENLVEARRRLLTSRCFNSLRINPVLNTITKVSQHDEKLWDELNWYLSIPDELKVLTPRILKYETNGRLEIVQDYYGYPTLAELYLYGDLHCDTWTSMLRHVLRIHQEFRKYSGSLDRESVACMYVGKTWDRLQALKQHDPQWEQRLARETVVFNGRPLRNWPVLQPDVRLWGQRLAASASICLVHGDFCFSNILFDVGNQIVRLIDPRGSFGRKGIYGDPRYDMAKLRHSVSGLYDYIVADLFDIAETEDGYTGRICANGLSTALGDVFDRMIQDAGYHLDEIRFVEGLLFLSMLPLHRDDPRRQHMMYVTGLSLLNEVL